MIGTRYDRNIGVWKESFQERLGQVTVGIAGLGGSGGCLASILARNGFGGLKLADPDVFEVHNIQRQLFANDDTVGSGKTEVTARGVHAINPAIRIQRFAHGITPETVDEFLEGCDFVHEAIDYSAVDMKLLLHRRARERGVITTSAAMVGTGVAALTFHPGGTSYEEYFEYPGGKPDGWKPPAEKIIRLVPDYLPLPFFLQRVEEGTVPTTADAAFFTGIAVAGIYKRILMNKPVEYAPQVVRADMLDDSMYSRMIY